jgi:hypothetical protein
VVTELIPRWANTELREFAKVDRLWISEDDCYVLVEVEKEPRFCNAQSSSCFVGCACPAAAAEAAGPPANA